MTHDNMPDVIWVNPGMTAYDHNLNVPNSERVRYRRDDSLQSVDVEALKRKIPAETDRQHFEDRGWNACLDHLVSQGYFNTSPHSNIDQKEAAYKAGYYDAKHGTPCEQIRWQQERELLLDKIANLNNRSPVTPEVARAALDKIYNRCELLIDKYCWEEFKLIRALLTAAAGGV